ncbi:MULTISPECIES: pentapeptide repeat-containing protein [unclassified Nostoc]|uniref:pentapeptide repeat-containing protein n=1 Tax=unclassified Nostoc TaxID=2593658 RepID=UPI001DEB95FD|nr:MULTISPECIES: pentapeptide repeat-containing protein [unclassified Nostoc]MBN3879231.1 pentapeptide repeat-containing protein [Nostoc sp. JL23]MBN3887951.1 pentapeptide repeat-containing protein [Nostoc sp. JL31]
MTEAILDGAIFGGEESTIKGANFDRASLRGATFIMVSLEQTTFKSAILDGTDFGIIGFDELDLTGASFQVSNFRLPEHIPLGGGRIILPYGRALDG